MNQIIIQLLLINIIVTIISSKLKIINLAKIRLSLIVINATIIHFCFEGLIQSHIESRFLQIASYLFVISTSFCTSLLHFNKVKFFHK